MPAEDDLQSKWKIQQQNFIPVSYDKTKAWCQVTC